MPPVWSGDVESVGLGGGVLLGSLNARVAAAVSLVIVGVSLVPVTVTMTGLGRRGAVIVGDRHIVGDRQGLVLGEEIERLVLAL